MKEDYLWDKTGEDAGIQGLENALKAFRFQENAPPELPQKVFTVEKKNGRRFFQFRFAFAAFAAAITVFSVIWFQIVGGGKIPAAETATKATEPKRAEKIAGDSFIETRDIEPVKASETAPRDGKSKVVRIRQRSAPVVRSRPAVLRKTKIKEPSETLTAEEKYAYDQLMLALSITGSQLKIVKDKVQGIEEQNAVIETAK